MTRKLRVTRKAYTRKAHHRKGYMKDVQKGRGVRMGYIHPTTVAKARVPKTTYYTEDIGAVGRSPKPRGMPKLKHGRMTHAIERTLGYERKPSEMSASEWQKVFRGSGISGKSWLGMLGTQVARRKFARYGSPRYEARKKFEQAIHVLSEEKNLTPREAVKKWHNMPHWLRAKVMPERSKRTLDKVV